MNRAIKLNYLFVGVIGGMLAMWACGDDTMQALTGSGGSKATGSGSSAAHAQDQPSGCTQWAVNTYNMDASQGEPDAPSLSAREEPFATLGGWLITKRCVAD